MADSNKIPVSVLGIDFEVDPRCAKDYRILKYLGEMDKGNPLHAADLMTLFTGDHEDLIIEAIRERNDGWCPIEEMSGVINEIIQQISQKDDSVKK